MFSTARILTFSLLASLVSALPANLTERTPELGDITDDEALSMIERATLATVYTKCSTANTVALTFGEWPTCFFLFCPRDLDWTLTRDALSSA